MKPSPKVIERVYCPMCSHFMGCITDDGKGPIMDGCNLHPLERLKGVEGAAEIASLVRRGLYEAAGNLYRLLNLEVEPCPMIEKLSKFQPLPRPTCLGNEGSHAGPIDSDGGGYQSIARRAMEDGYN
jgi:hypothetical protein